MKPKYDFFKNSKFAFEGLAAMLKNEAAFRFELCVIVPLALVSLFLPVSAAQHALPKHARYGGFLRYRGRVFARRRRV